MTDAPKTDDAEEYESLIQLHQKQLRAYLLVICPNRDAVDDILQETNRILWEKRATFELGSSFISWARTIARFQTLGFLKTSGRRTWLRFDSGLVETLSREAEGVNSMHKERMEHLPACIESLAEADRTLVVSRYQAQKSLKEVSRESGRAEGALKQVFLRIRKSLRECIERKLMQNSKER